MPKNKNTIETAIGLFYDNFERYMPESIDSIGITFKLVGNRYEVRVDSNINIDFFYHIIDNLFFWKKSRGVYVPNVERLGIFTNISNSNKYLGYSFVINKEGYVNPVSIYNSFNDIPLVNMMFPIIRFKRRKIDMLTSESRSVFRFSVPPQRQLSVKYRTDINSQVIIDTWLKTFNKLNIINYDNY